MDNPPVLNIASCLPDRATKSPHQLAVLFPQGRDPEARVSYTFWNFRELDHESDVLAAGLESIGITRGTRTVLMVTPSLEFFALTFALFKVGAVPVLVDPGMGLKNLKGCLLEAEPEAFIGIPKAHIARRVFGWAKTSLKTLVTVGTRLLWGGHTLRQVRRLGEHAGSIMAPTEPDELAAILFTSGSTGPPKGAKYTHHNFVSQVELLRTTYDIEPGEIDLTTFPLFALFAPALGMTAVIPDMDPTRPAEVHPPNVIGPIQSFGVTNLFGSPALLRTVGQYGEQHNVKLPTLKRVLSAGAAVPADIIERFSRMLSPGTQICTPYGATESLPVANIGSNEILEETRQKTDQGCGVCVGRAVSGMEVKIIRITDEPIVNWSDDLVLPPNQVGEIVVAGPVVTAGYYNRPHADELGKIADGDTKRHRMGDLGYTDDQGRIWVCGRKSHRVVTSSGTKFTLQCEAVFNSHPAVFRTALVGVGESDTKEPVLCVELLKGQKSASQETIQTELLALGAQQEHTQDIKTILFHPKFPVDIRHNSKIFREKLATWATKELR